MESFFHLHDIKLLGDRCLMNIDTVRLDFAFIEADEFDRLVADDASANHSAVKEGSDYRPSQGQRPLTIRCLYPDQVQNRGGHASHFATSTIVVLIHGSASIFTLNLKLPPARTPSSHSTAMLWPLASEPESGTVTVEFNPPPLLWVGD
jgi:hypothetical protein